MKKRSDSIRKWSTSQEIDFIKSMQPYNMLTRKERLMLYHEGLKLRDNWEKMDRKTVLRFIENEIILESCQA